MNEELCQAMVDEYQMTLRSVATAAAIVVQLDLPKMLRAINLAETVGPIAHPMLWIEKFPAMAEDKQLLEAALPLWKLARAIKLNQYQGETQS